MMLSIHDNLLISYEVHCETATYWIPCRKQAERVQGRRFRGCSRL